LPPPIVLYGGSFDPPHTAHLNLITHAMCALEPQQLRILPCHIPPHKRGHVASPEHRLAMLRAVLKGVPGLIVDDRELRDTGVSYTVNTVRAIRQEVGGQARLDFLLGWDSWAQFSTWYCWEGILDEVNLVVAPRPPSTNHSVARAISPDAAKLEIYEKNNRVAIEQLNSSRNGKIAMLEMDEIAIASSDIRTRLSRNEHIDDLVPGAVAEYIRTHDLYG